jgi:hypothetical protein
LKKGESNKRKCWGTSKKEHPNMSPPSSSLARKIVARKESLSITEE